MGLAGWNDVNDILIPQSPTSFLVVVRLVRSHSSLKYDERSDPVALNSSLLPDGSWLILSLTPYPLTSDFTLEVHLRWVHDK